MSFKRSRLARSSSMGEIGIVTQVRAVNPPKANWGANAASAAVERPVQKFSRPSDSQLEQPCRGILTIASPIRESSVENPDLNSDNAKVGGFLEACYLCKKKIGEGDDIFMYSYLRAFCSCECRDQHIALDRGIEKSAGDPAENAALRHWEQILKGRFGAQKLQIEKDAS
ncbi:hypothetical protein NE237_014531 [Protea cynaroides]|uniref:FLZ-type domain-containing protein n=1 Tax=Protea cynaroides TaxID=273540 RepID=A0A9Q0QQ71_9MAGN|nr:hypothetical protein NE237_014531 [Protea cynaroides]